jgi:hypothetical protein
MSPTHPHDEQLSAYIDRALTRRDSAEVAAHVEGCAQCAGRVQLMRATSQAVASLPEQEPPRSLDFAFLREHASNPVADGSRGFVARVIHGRPPTWLPTMVAAAAVVALAATWLPRLVPAGWSASHSSAGQALTNAGGGAKAYGPSSGPATPGGLSQDRGMPGALSAVPPGAAAPTSAGAAEKTVVGPDGSTITLLANPPTTGTGRPVQLLLRVVGGAHGTDLAPPGMEIFAGQQRLAGSEGTSRTLKSAEELDLTVEWSAGAVTGPPAPGTYRITGRVFLKNSHMVEVSLTYTVS